MALCTLTLAACVLAGWPVLAQQFGHASVPDWVKPGLAVYYDGKSAFVSNGQYNSPVQTVLINRVERVSGNTISGKAEIKVTNTPLAPGVYQWTWTVGGPADFPFWVNPADPVSSITGSGGVPYKVVGTGPYALGGKTYQATTIHAEVPDTGTQSAILFDSKTGLILAMNMISPSEEMHFYFNHMGYE